jgi:hypothetical protein
VQADARRPPLSCCEERNKPFNPAELGLEFSIADIEDLKGVQLRRAAEQMKFAS